MVEREGQRERRRDSAGGVNGPFKAVNQPFLPPFLLRERGGRTGRDLRADANFVRQLGEVD
jgi:hypothetical protein